MSHKNKGVDEDENLPPLLPTKLRKDITLHLCLPILNKVPMLQKMGEHSCHLICKYLKPVSYNENNYIVRAGEPLDAMLLITSSTVLMTDTTSNGSKKPVNLEKGDYFGEKLLEWGFDNSPTPELFDLPIYTKTVKTHMKVKAFALTAKNLKDLVFYKNNRAPVIIQRTWCRKRGQYCHHCHHCHHYHHHPAQPQSVTLAKDDIIIQISEGS